VGDNVAIYENAKLKVQNGEFGAGYEDRAAGKDSVKTDEVRA
jgi:hypothetical protein